MTLDSFLRILRVFNKRASFRPYWIEFVSGDRIEIRHPEVINQFGDVFAFRAPNREQRFFESGSVAQVIDPAPVQS